MNSYKQIPLLASLLSLTLVAGCETKEDNQIAKAQNCLDQATQSTASSCSSMVSGLESQAAYKIRCAAGFIGEGFTTAKFASAFSKIADKATNDASITAVANMMMSNTSASDRIYADCSKSGSAGMKNLAVLSKTATDLMYFTGADSAVTNALLDGQIDAGEITSIQASIGAMTNEEKEKLGQTVVLLGDAYCETGSSYSTSQICTDISAAKASSSSLLELGQKFADRIQSN